MSQHADILKHEIAKGISRGNSVKTILEDISDLLNVMEYPDDWCDLRAVQVHAEQAAHQMRAQSEGLYGVSYSQLTAFINEVESSRLTFNKS